MYKINCNVTGRIILRFTVGKYGKSVRIIFNCNVEPLGSPTRKLLITI